MWAPRLALTAALAASGVRAQARITNLVTPEAGSLAPVSGVVVGLADPAAHKACVYLESKSATFNGPKPFEGA